MNDEIREILEYMKIKQYISETNINFGYKTLSAGQVGLLLDYITNLQKENEDYKSRVEKAVEYIKTTKFLYKSHYDFKQDLLNILQNGSGEE